MEARNSAQMALIAEANYFRAFASQSVNVELSSDNLFVSVTGCKSNDRNGVIALEGVSDQQVIDTVQWVLGQREPATLFCLSNCSDQLMEDLKRIGAEPDQNSECMIASLTDLKPVETNRGVKIEEVESDGGLNQWLDVAEVSGWLDVDHLPVERQVNFDAMSHLIRSGQAKFCVAKFDHHVVGMSGFFTNGGPGKSEGESQVTNIIRCPEKKYLTTSLLTDLAVLPQFQRRGVGATMVKWWIEHFERAKVDLLVVTPTPESRRLYSKFGFRVVPIPKDSVFYLVPPI